MKLVERYLWLSQICLFGLLFVCSVILPKVMDENGGVSNFGEHTSTVVPYILSFSLCIIFLGLAAATVLKVDIRQRTKSALLAVIALLDLLVLISTFLRKIGWTYSEIHDDLGIALYAYEFALSVYIVMRRRTLLSAILTGIEFSGSMIGLLSAEKVVHLLYVGQIIGAIGFGILLATSFAAIVGSDLGINSTGREHRHTHDVPLAE